MKLKIPTLTLLGMSLLPSAHVFGAELKRANNNTSALNTTGAWAGAVVPLSGDVMLWDNTFTLPVAIASTPQLGGNMSVSGLKVTNINNVSTASATALTQVGFQNTSSANTLTVGTGGFDLSTASQALQVQSRFLAAGNQTWNIGNANTATNPSSLNVSEDLSLICQAIITGVNTIDLGGFTITKTGAGVAAVSSGHTLGNGTVNVNGGIFHVQSGASRTTTLQSTLAVNVNTGGTFALACQSAPASSPAITCNAAITLNTGGTLNLIPAQATPLNLSATGSINVVGNATIAMVPQLSAAQNAGSVVTVSSPISGAGNITYQNTLTTVVNRVRLAGDNSGYSGTLTMATASGNSRFLRLQSATAGSAAATWAITAGNTLEVDGVSVQLGTLNGAGAVTNSHASNTATLNVGAGSFSGVIGGGASPTVLNKTGAGTLTLTGANTYTGGTTVSAGTVTTTTAHTGIGSVQIGNAATFGVTQLAAGSTFTASGLSTGFSGGTFGTVRLNLGAFGSPTANVIAGGAVNFPVPTTVQVVGTGLTAGTFPLIGYSSLAGLVNTTLQLPSRVSGSLVDNPGASRVDLNISAVDFIRWTGAADTNWDVNDGTGTGTSNWQEVVSTNATKFLQGSAGQDAALFDDTATTTGATTVNLTTTLTPVGTTVNTSTLNYTFTGPGKISGAGGLVKQGTSTLTLANTAAYDMAGGATITGGTLQLGDGVTAVAGLLAGPIVDNATLSLNRAEDATIANAISGTGAVVKNGGSTVTTLTGALSYTGDTTVNTGTLALNSASNLAGVVNVAAGANLSFNNAGAAASQTGTINNAGNLTLNAAGSVNAVITGNGTVTVNTAGTKTIGGNAANTYTGLTTVSAGVLALSKTTGSVGVPAIGGDLLVNGTGVVTVTTLGNQLADTSNITVENGGQFLSVESATVLKADTVANVTINAATPVSTISGLNITGILKITAGAQHDVANSGGTCSAGTVQLSNTSIRLGLNGADSTLNIGTGGITLANAEVLYGSVGSAARTGRVNLSGDVTSSGTSAFNINTGLPVSIIDLKDFTRTFNVIGGVTTVKPNIVSTTALDAGLTKTGNGTLVLTGVSTYTGPTTLTAGTLAVNGSLNGTSLVLNGGTLTGSGNIATDGTGAFAGSGSKIAPGNNGTGNLTLTTGSADAVLSSAVDASATGALVYTLTTPAATPRLSVPGGAVVIGTGKLGFDDLALTAGAGFGPGVYTLVESANDIDGTLAANVAGKIGEYDAVLSLADANTDLVLTVTQSALQTWRNTYFGSIANTGDGANDADPDGDGASNILEFATGSLPGDINSLPAQTVANDGTVFTLDYSRPKAVLKDVTLTGQASDGLDAWSNTGVTETILSDDGTTQVVRLSIPATLQRHFLRILAAAK